MARISSRGVVGVGGGAELYCGLRSAEVLGLDVTEVDVGGRWLKVVGKGQRERRVPLDADVASVIQVYLLAERPESANGRLILVAKGPHRGRPRPGSAGFPLQPAETRIMSRSSPVPLQSPSQARATFMPDTAKAVNRYPSGLPQDSIKAPVLLSPRLNDTSSMVHFRSPSWLTPTAFSDGFPQTLTTLAHFTTAACGGLTPAPACRCRRTYLHLCNSMVAVDRSVFYIRTSPDPFRTHQRRRRINFATYKRNSSTPDPGATSPRFNSTHSGGSKTTTTAAPPSTT